METELKALRNESNGTLLSLFGFFIEQDEFLLRNFRGDETVTRKRPVIHNAKISDGLAIVFVETIIKYYGFAIGDNFAIFIDAKIVVEMAQEFRGFHVQH